MDRAGSDTEGGAEKGKGGRRKRERVRLMMGKPCEEDGWKESRRGKVLRLRQPERRRDRQPTGGKEAE